MRKTTSSLMAVLSSMYEQSSLANKVYLIKKLFNMRMTECRRFWRTPKRVQWCDGLSKCSRNHFRLRVGMTQLQQLIALSKTSIWSLKMSWVWSWHGKSEGSQKVFPLREPLWTWKAEAEVQTWVKAKKRNKSMNCWMLELWQDWTLKKSVPSFQERKWKQDWG